LNKIKAIVLNFDPDAQVILFGSRARGDFQRDSDWDILIILKISVTESLKEKIHDEIFVAEIDYAQAISTIIYSQKAWNDLQITPLYKNIEKEGIAL
jgi:predicted nucleotidyltransferase